MIINIKEPCTVTNARVRINYINTVNKLYIHRNNQPVYGHCPLRLVLSDWPLLSPESWPRLSPDKLVTASSHNNRQESVRHLDKLISIYCYLFSKPLVGSKKLYYCSLTCTLWKFQQMIFVYIGILFVFIYFSIIPSLLQ